ncbi:uncharacterized protein LOC141728648 [Zonotrichia albicollis]|uniref:uncharacterized protein LOC141728648 n=1 Tax=Zonotrichia albicollis TaxID=44394 RepID=UPI003D80F770
MQSPSPSAKGSPHPEGQQTRAALRAFSEKPQLSYIRIDTPIFVYFQATLTHFTAAAPIFKLCPPRKGALFPSVPSEASHRPPAPRPSPGRAAEPPARGRPPPRPPQRPAPAPPELQLVQVLEQAAGAVGHGGGAVEAAAELPARLLLLLRLLLRPLAGLGADPGLGHPTHRCRRRNLAAAAPSPRPAGGGGGRMPAPRSWPKKEPPRRRPPRPPRPRAGPAGAASRSAAGPPRPGRGQQNHRGGRAGRDQAGSAGPISLLLSSEGSLAGQPVLVLGHLDSKEVVCIQVELPFLCISFCPLSLALLLGTTEKRLLHLLDAHPLGLLQTRQFPDMAEGCIHGSGQPTKTSLQSPQHRNNNDKDGPT